MNMTNAKYLLEDDQIGLRALAESDISGNYQHWFNDPEVVRFNAHGRFPMTIDQLTQYTRENTNSKRSLVLAILDKKTGRHIGNISLQEISWIDRSAVIAFVLGEKEYRGKGIMCRAGTLLINHGFNVLNLHRISCGTLATNIGMLRLAVKLGMKQEGIRRQAIFKNGVYVDIVEFGLLKSSKSNDESAQ